MREMKKSPKRRHSSADPMLSLSGRSRRKNNLRKPSSARKSRRNKSASSKFPIPKPVDNKAPSTHYLSKIISARSSRIRETKAQQHEIKFNGMLRKLREERSMSERRKNHFDAVANPVKFIRKVENKDTDEYDYEGTPRKDLYYSNPYRSDDLVAVSTMSPLSVKFPFRIKKKPVRRKKNQRPHTSRVHRRQGRDSFLSSSYEHSRRSLSSRRASHTSRSADGLPWDLHQRLKLLEDNELQPQLPATPRSGRPLPSRSRSTGSNGKGSRSSSKKSRAGKLRLNLSAVPGHREDDARAGLQKQVLQVIGEQKLFGDAHLQGLLKKIGGVNFVNGRVSDDTMEQLACELERNGIGSEGPSKQPTSTLTLDKPDNSRKDSLTDFSKPWSSRIQNNNFGET